MPILLAVPADDLRLRETTLQVLDQEILILAHQDRDQPLAAGCDQYETEGGLSDEEADLLCGFAACGRPTNLSFRSHSATLHFL
jgi:hypothetical protein